MTKEEAAGDVDSVEDAEVLDEDSGGLDHSSPGSSLTLRDVCCTKKRSKPFHMGTQRNLHR